MKTSLILLSLILILIPTACQDRQDLQNSKNKITPSYSELPQYEHKWIEFRTPDGIKTRETEFYISEFGDTLVFQNKVFQNDLLDSTLSDFLDFKASWVNDSIISGSVSVYSTIDHNIKSPLLERNLNLKFIQVIKGKKGTVEFISQNSNVVEFEFQNDSDSLIGILTDYRQFDTLINNEKHIRIVEVKFPLDNKPMTNNVFIYVNDFFKNKNKR